MLQDALKAKLCLVKASLPDEKQGQNFCAGLYLVAAGFCLVTIMPRLAKTLWSNKKLLEKSRAEIGVMNSWSSLVKAEGCLAKAQCCQVKFGFCQEKSGFCQVKSGFCQVKFDFCQETSRHPIVRREIARQIVRGLVSRESWVWWSKSWALSCESSPFFG